MAVLYITECDSLALESYGRPIAAPRMAPIAEQHVAIGGSSAQSATFNPKTRFIMVHTDAICSIAWGVNPTAVATAQRLAANETRYYGVNPGEKIAVITNS
jgi:hypothetical protein